MAILANPSKPVRPRPAASLQATWQAEMRDAVRDVAELCRLLELPENAAVEPWLAPESFPLFVPKPFLARMRRGDWHDPLLRQVLPVRAETDEVAGFVADPVGDHHAKLRRGLLQKYPGRVLLVVTGACAVHCRYCFRRHYPYHAEPQARSDWDEPLACIAADPSIHEVILSGGDPLTLSDDPLAHLTERIARIPHVTRLRVHTRLPVMIPQRVTDEMLQWLTQSRLTPILVVHINHAQEIDPAVSAAIARLIDGGAVVLNQAVLLRGVNDSIAAQASLCERLVAIRVIPYYLHQLDRVAGAAHFEVPEDVGRQIIIALRDRLPGYAVPRFAKEVPGALSKDVIA